MNEVIKTMLVRRSIRAYKDIKLTDEELFLLKQAALSAPTAMNRNDQRFAFVSDASVITRIENDVVEAVRDAGDTAFLERILSRNGKVIYDAPLFVGIFGKESNYAGVDAGIAVQNLALAAKALGLDLVILGMPSLAFSGKRGEALQKLLGVPEEFKFRIGIAIGHPAMDKDPHEWDESHVIEIKA